MRQHERLSSVPVIINSNSPINTKQTFKLNLGNNNNDVLISG